MEQAVAVGVDGIEHCSCVTDRGFGQVSEETVATLARSRIAVCPTIGVDAQLMKAPPPAIKAMMARMGVTAEQMLQARWDLVGAGCTELGCVWCPGLTPASGQLNGTACSRMPYVSW